MLPSMLYMALAKFATHKLADVNPDEVARILKVVRRASLGTSWVPAIAGLGTGFLAGAAVGVLFARRPGSELRSELIDRVKRALSRPAAAPEPATRSEPVSPATSASNGGAPAEI